MPHIPDVPLIDSLVKVALRLSAKGDYTTLPGLTPLAGTFEHVRGVFDLERFLKEVVYQHTTAYDGWFHFNPGWLPAAPAAPAAMSLALIEALSSKSATPGDIAQALGAAASRKLVIGGRVVDAPSSPSDARGDQAVALVTAELKKHGVQSSAA